MSTEEQLKARVAYLETTMERLVNDVIEKSVIINRLKGEVAEAALRTNAMAVQLTESESYVSTIAGQLADSDARVEELLQELKSTKLRLSKAKESLSDETKTSDRLRRIADREVSALRATKLNLICGSNVYKSTICRNRTSKACPYGDACVWLHSDEPDYITNALERRKTAMMVRPRGHHVKSDDGAIVCDSRVDQASPSHEKAMPSNDSAAKRSRQDCEKA